MPNEITVISNIDIPITFNAFTLFLFINAVLFLSTFFDSINTIISDKIPAIEFIISEI